MSAPITCGDGRVEIRVGDCRELLREMDAESIDSCVTDPPYHLTSIVKRFGTENAAPAQSGKTGAYARSSKGFMGQTWDGGDIAFQPETWAEVWRVLKPGAHLLAFGGTRTYHRLACAIEDAGFEVRDCIAWVYATGFPKSHDVQKGIDRALGREGERGEYKQGYADRKNNWKVAGNAVHDRPWMHDAEAVDRQAREYLPATHEAAQWQGWGTALKPALEPIVVARKPLAESSIARQVLATGTGALNIDASRVTFASDADKAAAAAAAAQRACQDQNIGRTVYGRFENGPASLAGYAGKMDKGRWPANLIHDGDPAVIGGFPRDDGASAARFFYCAKPTAAERRRFNIHPTVKPAALMQYLVRLVTPPGGRVLDPFGGSGSTGLGAAREGFQAVLCELSPDYAEIGRRRIDEEWGIREPTPEDPAEWGPLFDLAEGSG